MTEMRTRENVMMFVDVRNVLGAIGNDLQYCQVDFYSLINNLTAGRRLVRPYVYDGFSDNERFESLHTYLRNCGCTIRISNLHDHEDGRQKGVDVDLATDMVRFACMGSYDVAILVSGDCDFVPAVEKVKEQGKRVEVACFGNTISNRLRCSADRYHNLDSVPLLKIRNPGDSEEVSE